MYQIPNMFKNPSGARFITACKICSTEQISYVQSIYFYVYITHFKNWNLIIRKYSMFNHGSTDII